MSRERELEELVASLQERLRLCDGLKEEVEELRSRPGPEWSETAKTVKNFSGGSSVVATQWLNELKSARAAGKWSWGFTSSVLYNRMVGAASFWHRDSGMKAEGFDEYVRLFEVEWVPPARTRDLIDDFLNNHQKRGESVEVYVRRKNAIATSLNYDMETLKDQVLDGLLPEYDFMIITLRAGEF